MADIIDNNVNELKQEESVLNTPKKVKKRKLSKEQIQKKKAKQLELLLAKKAKETLKKEAKKAKQKALKEATIKKHKEAVLAKKEKQARIKKAKEMQEKETLKAKRLAEAKKQQEKAIEAAKRAAIVNYGKQQKKYLSKIDSLIKKDKSFSEVMKCLLASKDNSLAQMSRREDKAFDGTWIETLEEGFVAIENITKNPKRFIKEVGNIVPVELAKRITSQSVQHLASHTQYVKDISPKGDVIPNKLLTISGEDDYQIYENRFVMTLIDKLVIFIEKRYEYIKKHGETRDSDALEIKSKMQLGEAVFEYEGKIKVSLPSSDGGNRATNEKLLERITTLRKKMGYFLSCEFMTNMAGAKPVKSPIIQTNVISKNKDYHACYKLWKFLDTYSKLGVSYTVKEVNAQFKENYTKQLYSLILSSMLTLSTNRSDVINFDSSATKKKTFSPRILTNLDDAVFSNEKYANIVEVINPKKPKFADPDQEAKDAEVKLAAKMKKDAAIAERKERERLKKEEAKRRKLEKLDAEKEKEYQDRLLEKQRAEEEASRRKAENDARLAIEKEKARQKALLDEENRRLRQARQSVKEEASKDKNVEDSFLDNNKNDGE